MAKNTKKKGSNSGAQQSALGAPMLLLVLLCLVGLVLGVWLISTGKSGTSGNSHEITMQTGQSRTLETTLTAPFTCSVSDDTIISIDEKHLMTALSPGTAVIVAQSADGSRETFYITVSGDPNATLPPPAQTTTTTTTTFLTETTTTTTTLAPGSVTGIELTFNAVSLKIGESKMPIVTMSPENATDKTEKWTSSDESVATVDWLGNITAVGAGICTIRVTSVNNPAVYAEVAVTVTGNTAQTPGNIELIDGVTYVDGILIVNKTYALPKDYAPGINAEAKAAFDRMQLAAASAMLDINIVSGYRSYATQEATYTRFVNRDGQAAADLYSARPGHSEHQTGLAFDINYAGDSFANTPEAEWLAENCWKYGFIIRYPKGKEQLTGYQYEPWHVRYLGADTAERVYNSGLTLEEYLGITSQYAESDS